ncbi:MAG: hypothetical protein AB1791_17620 [Chloroflexota bacterium]
MGFPTWTLWGMGLSALGALIWLTLALIAQTPRFLRRLGLSGFRLDLRVRAFTGYALAFLLLAIGFFLAGVPLVEPAADTLSQQPAATAPAGQLPTQVAAVTVTPSPTPTATPRLTPETGAFGQPLAEQTTTPAGETPVSPTNTATLAPALSTATPTPTPSPTQTATPSPTITPSPTLTPTPITGRTAVVTTGGSTLWVRRIPAGETLVLLQDGDLVILLSGHANHGGVLWQEISTVGGIAGWVPAEYLSDEG